MKSGVEPSFERRGIGRMMLATLLLSADPFLIERIDTPEGVAVEVGGIDVDAQGRVWVSPTTGSVCSGRQTGATFATGLHDPLGMLVREDGSVVVMQRPELTKLVDVDGDGQADEYNTLCDDFGLSGNSRIQLWSGGRRRRTFVLPEHRQQWAGVRHENVGRSP